MPTKKINSIIDWLLEGDPAIGYCTKRDILEIDDPMMQKQICDEGWGKQFLSLQDSRGHWGIDFYRPKWSCTHYTLLEIKEMGMPKGLPTITSIVDQILTLKKALDGGISFWQGYKHSDICVDGMVLNFASYFIPPDERFDSLIDLMLKAQLKDGGWNCRWLHKAVHSSFHTTLSVLEGLWEYRINGGNHRLEELLRAEDRAIEFLLHHHLYKSHQTLEVVDSKMLYFTYPSRWRYDVLRVLYHFATRGIPFDDRMDSALRYVQSKRNPDGVWILNSRHPGKEFFHMEKVGSPSRWISYRALYIIKKYPQPYFLPFNSSN